MENVKVINQELFSKYILDELLEQFPQFVDYFR